MKHSEFLLGLSLALIVLSCKPAQEQVVSVGFRDGQLKIVQLTDLHYEAGAEGSSGLLESIGRILDEEQPDMVVFTGDVVLCADAQRGWDEVLEGVTSRRIPWAAVLGNHDDEHTWTRARIIEYLAERPYSLVRTGPEGLTGAGNYVVTVNGSGGSNGSNGPGGKPAAALYFMDSGSYSAIEGVGGYAWFGFDQVEWYRAGSAALTANNGGRPLPALAFFHIPLQEYAQMTLKEDSVLVGMRNEAEHPGALNTGMYAAMLSSGDVMGTFVGHDHNNDYIGVCNGIALAYGRFSGGRVGYTYVGCGARVVVLKEGARAFDTWIRTADGQKLYEASYPGDFSPAPAE